jgi:outer membrane protein
VTKFFLISFFFGFSVFAQLKPAPLKINDCFEYALKHSPTIKKLQINLSNNEYDTIIARAAFDLGINIGSTKNTETQRDGHAISLNQEIPGGIDLTARASATYDDIENTDSSDLSLTISKQLLGGGTLEESLDQIRDSLVNELIARNSLSREKRQLKLLIQRQFYSVIRNRQALEIERRRLESARKNLEHAKERDKPLDIANAEIEIPESELNAIRAERRIQTSLDELKVLIGMSPDLELVIDEEFTFDLSTFNVDEDLLYAETHEERFVNNSLEKEKAERDLRISKLRTQVDLSVFLTHNVDSKGDENANFRGRDEQIVGLNLSWDFGRRADKARLAQSQNDLDENEVNRYVLRQDKFLKLRKLNRDIEETSKAVVIQEQRILLNARQIELYKDRWENGEIDILEYIRSQNRQEDSRVQLINLKTNYMDLVNEYLFEVGK